MGSFQSDFSCLGDLLGDLGRLSSNIQRNEANAVRSAALAYSRDVKILAPVDTGQYRASIRVDMTTEGMRQIALIGTPMPQACRLEYGFYGTDSLGRTYQQYPRPHWRPAWDHNFQKYQRIMISALSGESINIGAEFGDFGAEVRDYRSNAASYASRLRPDLLAGVLS